MRTADRFPISNWLATHPRTTAALLIALILVAGQMDARWLA